MSVVLEMKIEGYKSFYIYDDGVIYVTVNKQNQFEAGQVDVGDFNSRVLSEQQAKEARSVEAEFFDANDSNVETCRENYIKLYRKYLQKNGFDLEKE